MPDKSKITEELEALQLEEAREIAVDRRNARADRANRSRAIEASLKRDRQNQERIQAACVHRKGGKGTSQLYQGNDHNYALITHTLSHGITIVVCQRCSRIWEPPVALEKKATPEQKAKYRADMMEYRRVLNLPTDNEPSGTTLFAFSAPDEDAA
jgi:hypothetical protein